MSVGSRKLSAGIGALALLQTAAWAQTVPLVGDTFIMPGGGTNYGSLVNVNVGGPSAFQGLWLFDLTKLPAGTVASDVAGASLRLFVNKIGTAGSINVNAPSSSWSESTANGLPGPGIGQLVAGPIGVSVGASYISIPVTSQVQAWLNGAPNNGFIITATPSSTSLFFDSKETTATSHPAVLEIDLGGQTGAVGAQGPPGAVGAIGATGPAGAIGPQGATGAAGAAGSTGPTGAVGPAGAVGVTGSQGPSGVAGATGPTGSAGPAGATGATGLAGVAGAAGPTGPAGAVGSPGATGSQGVAGAAGAAGAAGRINNNFSYVLLPSAANITIADTETHTNIQVDNVTFEPTILLPHSRVIGAGTVLSISVHDWAVNTNGILVAPQTGDQLLLPAEGHINPIGIVNPGSTWSLNYSCELVSDGNGHWYFLINN